MLDRMNGQEAAEMFRAYYLEGSEQPSARTLASRFFVDKRTVFKQVLRACEELRVILFGIDALFDLEGAGEIDCKNVREADKVETL